jgi:hypothetical protein
MVKKSRKDYDYYSLNIPNELRIFYEAFISKHPNLGFKNVSQYLLHILQGKAEEILKDNPDLKKIEQIKLSSGIYKLQEDGTYKKFSAEDKLLLKEIENLWGKTPKDEE